MQNAVLTAEEWANCYDACVQAMRTMYSVCALIHADLSEYNLLWLDGRVRVIDMGQSVLRSHPNAPHFAQIDCENVARFFAARGVHPIVPPGHVLGAIMDDRPCRHHDHDHDHDEADQTEPAPGSIRAYAQHPHLSPFASDAFARRLDQWLGPDFLLAA